MAARDSNNINVTSEDKEIKEDTEINLEGRPHSYTLPSFRYVNIVLAIVFIDGIVSVALWLTGGNTDYFVDNITDFHMKKSVFDLALLSSLKVIVFAPGLSYLEATSLQQIKNPYDSSLKAIVNALHVLTITLSLGVLAYSTTKGGFILDAILHDDSYIHMHVEYNALVISCVAFSLIQFGMLLYSFRAMRQLKVMRILHLYNDDGQEIDKDGKPVKKPVDLKRLVSLAKPETPMLIVASLCLLVSSGSNMLAPLFFGKVVDAAKHSMAELNKTVLTLFVIYIVGSIFSMARSWLFTLAGQRVVARLRKDMFKSIIKQEVAFFDTNRTGELCNRLSSDTQVLQNAVTVNFSMLSRYLLQMVGSLVFMFTLNPALTGVLLSVVPIISIGAVQYGKFMKSIRQKFQDRLADAGTQAEENLSSIRTVRSFSGEQKAMAKYGAEVDKSYARGRELAIGGGIFQGVIGMVVGGAITLTLWYGGKLVYENSEDSSKGISPGVLTCVFEGAVGTVVGGAITLVLWYGGKLVHENSADSTIGITPGVLTSFLLYTLQVAMAFALMSALYGDFMQALGASIRIFELMDRKPLVSGDGGAQLPELDGRVEFKSVDFTYPSRPETKVVQNMSFEVEPGQMVALVGPSGGGKSTLVNLIERFYDPDAGTITVGGHDVRDLDPDWLRQKMSMVSQEPTLFACSIRDNIAFGKLTATDEEVAAVSKEANAHDFIMTFEEGYDTLVGERGVRLSGGQKQRIAIARALIMDPVILLLDEATSALDAESEHLVQEAIDRAMKGRTVVVIAHRLSTVRDAAKVIVIDKGMIAEQGTHDELLHMNGVYKRLVLRQLTAGTITEQQLINFDNDSNESNGSTENGKLLD